ncbi:MAG: hypothetical protein EBU46_20045, partial [Nitrosomonadaceae bacterium]|nr:hypothetical protein [Nitrosomonadaceae bacterium]
MGTKMIESGKPHQGRMLIANSLIHDNSKFFGVEWDNLDPSIDISAEPNRKLKLNLAVQQHNRTNPHHPEYWPGGINGMPALYLAEMVCDWWARSIEFGTSLHDWIDVGAAERFRYTKGSDLHKQLVELAAMICDKPFEPVSNDEP